MITRTCLNRNELYEIRLALERAGIYYKIRQIEIKQIPEAINDRIVWQTGIIFNTDDQSQEITLKSKFQFNEIDLQRQLNRKFIRKVLI